MENKITMQEELEQIMKSKRGKITEIKIKFLLDVVKDLEKKREVKPRYLVEEEDNLKKMKFAEINNLKKKVLTIGSKKSALRILQV